MSAEDQHRIPFFPQRDPSFVRANGAELWTADGTRYLDLGGASQGVANFGHNHPKILEAIREQAGRLIHLTGTNRSPVREAFLESLHRLLPAHLSRSYLCNSGTEAVEAAMKFAHVATGRRRFVAARNAFHGRTLGALSATFKPAYRRPFEALLQPVDYVPFNDAAALESAVTQDTAAVILEPVQGEGGIHVASSEYLRAAERIAHDHGALLIIDEVQTGLGRTGRDFAIDGTGIRPDILLLGKSIAGGLPMGVTATTDAVASRLPPASHGTTFGGAPLACAAATAALDVLRSERLSARAAEEGGRLISDFRSMSSPLVRDIRGRGLMIGLDLRIKPAPVLDRLFARRCMALSAGHTVLRLLPPLVTARPDLDAASASIGEVMADPELVPGIPLEAT